MHFMTQGKSNEKYFLIVIMLSKWRTGLFKKLIMFMSTYLES